ncbi:ethanolamine ammonia-lyase reactivating factor EutA [Escherichia coli]
MNTRQLLSVGIDIGTTTTQVIFSGWSWLTVRRSQVPRYEFIKREISWQSPVFFTPVDKQGGLKEAELKTLILEQYHAAGIEPESVDSGAITSPPVKRENPQCSPGGDGALSVAGRFISTSARPLTSNP